jgi:hypothetical protein
MMPAALVYALAAEDRRQALNRERARRLADREQSRSRRRRVRTRVTS